LPAVRYLRIFEDMKSKSLHAAATEAAGFLAALAHPARLRIVCGLIDGERPAGELASAAGLRSPLLSQQAAILEARGIIARRRLGRSVLYRLASPSARRLTRLLHSLFCAPGRRRAPR
jgi:DNA-binding transcriptional ArsR family regulator